MSFTPLGDTLSHQSGKNPTTKKPPETISAVVEFAEKTLIEIFGQETAVFAKPLFLKNRTLTITCMNANMAQEIRAHQQEIIDKTNKKLGKKEIDRIRYLT